MANEKESLAVLIDKMDDPQIAIITLSKNTHQSSIIFFIAFMFMLIFVLGPMNIGRFTSYGIKIRRQKVATCKKSYHIYLHLHVLYCIIDVLFCLVLVWAFAAMQ